MSLEQIWQYVEQFDREKLWIVYIFAIIFIALLVDLMQKIILGHIQKRLKDTKNVWDDALVHAVRRPLSLLIWIIGLTMALQVMDFKPANVILSLENSAKITDFGLAKLARSSIHTQIGSIMGTPAYMSPEQAQGQKVDLRSDIYAFGVTLYRMLAGHLPFEGDVESIIAQKLTAEPAKIAHLEERIPKRLRQIVMQMLNKEADKRPDSLDEVVQILKTGLKAIVDW